MEDEKKFNLVEIVILVMLALGNDILVVIGDLVFALPVLGQIVVMGIEVVNVIITAVILFWFIMKLGFAGWIGVAQLSSSLLSFFGIPGRTAGVVLGIYLANHPKQAALAKTALTVAGGVALTAATAGAAAPVAGAAAGAAMAGGAATAAGAASAAEGAVAAGRLGAMRTAARQALSESKSASAQRTQLRRAGERTWSRPMSGPEGTSDRSVAPKLSDIQPGRDGDSPKKQQGGESEEEGIMTEGNQVNLAA